MEVARAARVDLAYADAGVEIAADKARDTDRISQVWRSELDGRKGTVAFPV